MRRNDESFERIRVVSMLLYRNPDLSSMLIEAFLGRPSPPQEWCHLRSLLPHREKDLGFGAGGEALLTGRHIQNGLIRALSVFEMLYRNSILSLTPLVIFLINGRSTSKLSLLQ